MTEMAQYDVLCGSISWHRWFISMAIINEEVVARLNDNELEKLTKIDVIIR